MESVRDGTHDLPKNPKDIVLKLLVWLPECMTFMGAQYIHCVGTCWFQDLFCFWISWNWGDRLDKLSKACGLDNRGKWASHLIHLDRLQILKSKWVTLTLQCWRRTLKNKRSECDCCDYLFGDVWDLYGFVGGCALVEVIITCSQVSIIPREW